MTSETTPSSDRTQAASTLLTAMERLRACPSEEDASWRLLEAHVIQMLPDCRAEHLIELQATYLAGSAAVLHALPARQRFRRIFDVMDQRHIRETLPVDVFSAAIEQRFLRPDALDRLLAHRPLDPEWTAHLCETLSPLESFSINGSWSPWGAGKLELPEPIDLARLARVLEAQVRDHPQAMARHLREILDYSSHDPAGAIPLLIAGARPGRTLCPREPAARDLLDRASSHHGMISLHAEHGPLEKAVEILVKPAPAD